MLLINLILWPRD